MSLFPIITPDRKFRSTFRWKYNSRVMLYP